MSEEQDRKDRWAREQGFRDYHTYEADYYQKMYGPDKPDNNLPFSGVFRSGGSSIEGCLVALAIMILAAVMIVSAIINFVESNWPYLTVIALAVITGVLYKKLPQEKKEYIKLYINQNKQKSILIGAVIVVATGAFLYVTTSNIEKNKATKTHIYQTDRAGAINQSSQGVLNK